MTVVREILKITIIEGHNGIHALATNHAAGGGGNIGVRYELARVRRGGPVAYGTSFRF